MNKFYASFLWHLDSNLIGIFIGIISSVGINILTSEGLNTLYSVGICLLFLSIWALIALSRYREKTNDHFKGLEKNSTVKSDENWRTSMGFRTKAIGKFYLAFWVLWITLVFGIAFIVLGRVAAETKNQESQSITSQSGK